MPNFFEKNTNNFTKQLSFNGACGIIRSMKLHMKHFRLALLSLSLALGAGAGLLFGGESLSADALAEESLFLPASYEQYLPLNNPTDAAINEDYIAVADGNLLYLYSRDTGRYTQYAHIGSDEAERGISALHFAADGRLYFSDHNSQLFLCNPNETNLTAAIQSNVPCSNFVISGNTLYTAAVAGSATTLYAIPIPTNNAPLTLAQATEVGTIESTETPCMTYSENTLYCAINDTVYRFAYDGIGAYTQSRVFLAGDAEITGLTSLFAFQKEFYFTVSGSRTDSELYGLYRAQLGVSAQKLLSGTGFTGLLSYGDSLFCIKGASVRELRLEGDRAEFSGYEISAGSDTFNRESEAGETARGGSLLAVADRGNKRVLLYDRDTAKYSSIPLDGTPACVATDGERIAVGVGNTVLLYTYGLESPYKTQAITNGTAVTGVTFVYGTCYYITDHSYGVVEEGSGEITRSSSPTAITSDIWGNLYVSDNNFRITKYTEAEFVNGEDGTLVTENWQLPAGFASLRADFDGNLYYLVGNALYCNGGRFAAVDGASLVYRGANASPLSPVSFALGYEDGGVYFQYGDFVVYRELSFPTLSTIPASEVTQQVFSSHDASSVRFVDVRENATSIRVGLERDSDYFAYRGHLRSGSGRGILLAQTDKYSLVALYGDHAYTIGLYLTEDCTDVPVEAKAAAGDRYISNEIPLSYYPCLAEELTCKTLTRAAQVSLHATVTVSDVGYDFAYISTELDGETLQGYVPLAYLSECSPVTTPANEFKIGYLKANASGVIFRSESGERLTITDRTQVKLYEENALSIAAYTDENGVVYTAQVTDDMLESGSSNALRMSLIIVLCVIAVGVATAYLLFIPKRKKK